MKTVWLTGAFLFSCLTAADLSRVDVQELTQMGRHAVSLFDHGSYVQAMEAFARCAQLSSQLSRRPDELLYLSNLIGTLSRMQQYGEIEKPYLRAAILASQLKDERFLVVLNIQRASARLQLGDATSARAGLARIRPLFDKPGPARQYLPEFTYLEARIKLKQGLVSDAFMELARAATLAEQAQNEQIQLRALEKLAREQAERGQWTQAATTIDRAKRASASYGKPVTPATWRNEALVLAGRKQFPLALEAIDHAITADRLTSDIPLWELLYFQARIQQQALLTADANNSYQRAIDLVRKVRLATPVLPATTDQLEEELSNLYRDYSEFLAMQAVDTSNDALASKALSLLEENRGRGYEIRRGLITNIAKKYPTIYPDLLIKYRDLESDSRPEADAQRDQLLLQMGELFANQSITKDSTALCPGPQCDTWRQKIGSDELVLIFSNFSERSLYLWALTSRKQRLIRIGSPAPVRDRVTALRSLIESDAPQTSRASSELFMQLLGQLQPDELAKPHWTICPDAPLFSLPFGALVKPNGHFLAEDSTIRLVPRLSGWAEQSATPFRGRLAAFGDPIYNAADARRRTAATAQGLSRLPGSGVEANTAAAVWRSRSFPAVAITSTAVTAARLQQEATGTNEILHLAVHAQDHHGSPRLVVRLGEAGSFEYFSGNSLFGEQVTARLVVMNGCRTGAATVTPASGALGLVRDWLLAGADSVIATHWPTVDTQGHLFSDFYRALGRQEAAGPVTPALALQRAQVQMIRSGGWRANPRHWAAYFVTGKY